MPSATGSPTETDLEKALGAALDQPPSSEGALQILRLLESLSSVSSLRSCVLLQSQLLAYPDPAVRAQAALLIASTSKSAPLVLRLLSDADASVQAKAVEALWTFDADEARPLLSAALKSPHDRVIANAALGLYRIGDLSAIPVMLEMARHGDPKFRETAIWAMGETGDPRFLARLADLYQQSAGAVRMAAVRALSRIRRRERELAEAGSLDIRVSEAVVRPDGARRLALTLWSPRTDDLASLKPAQFAFWEGGSLASEYSVAAAINPAILIVGFILPRFAAVSDPYRAAIQEGMNRAMRFRRPRDLWRIDRYLLERPAPGAGVPQGKAGIPYDDELLGSQKTLRGFLRSEDLLHRVISSSGSEGKAAKELGAAIDRQSDAMVKISGTRQIFLFLHAGCADWLGGRLDQFIESIRSGNIQVHGFAPESAADCGVFRDLCLAVKGGTFATASPKDLPGMVEEIYSGLLNRYEATYRIPGDPAAEGKLLITSELGCGKAEFPLVNSQPVAV